MHVGVHDGHRLVRDPGVGVYLLEYLVDVRGEAFLIDSQHSPPPPHDGAAFFLLGPNCLLVENNKEIM